MKEKFLIMIPILGIIIVAVMLIMLFLNHYGEYEYTSFDNKTGTAYFCITLYGRSYCQSNNETINVIRYKKLK